MTIFKRIVVTLSFVFHVCRFSLIERTFKRY